MSKFILILLLCFAFSNAALDDYSVEDFELFLRRSVYGEPDDSADPELAELQNAEERSGKFEGDILLTEEQIQELVADYSGESKNAIIGGRLWPNKQVVYEIVGNFTPEQVGYIESAVANISASSCVTFRKKTAADTAWIAVESAGKGCYATIGYGATRQVINLEPGPLEYYCFRYGTVLHEFLHGLGFFHMHSTYDRDDWIKVNWAKIAPGYEHNFNKLNSTQVTNLGLPYEYESVLHYSGWAFSVDSNTTITPLKPAPNMGQRVAMSSLDIQRLNRLYNCPGF